MLKFSIDKENLESIKKAMTCFLQGLLSKIISRFLTRTFGDQKAINPYIQRAKRKKNYQPRILYLTKLCFKSEVEGFPGGAVVKNPPANAGGTGSSPGLERSHMP